MQIGDKVKTIFGNVETVMNVGESTINSSIYKHPFFQNSEPLSLVKAIQHLFLNQNYRCSHRI